MKLLRGVVLLCLAITWVAFWCAQLSDPLLVYYPNYEIVFVLVASLALIPLIWATSLLDEAIRAPLAPAAPKWHVAGPVQRSHIPPESDNEPTSFAPDEGVPDASVADAIVEGKSRTAAAA